ncbi:MAG: hypothetical protein L0312_17205, partial [Acidobacteria bacterium]|nr:hypothetical protein [Acidobacteriota bacterium]
AAGEVREQRTLNSLRALVKAMPNDPERFAKMKAQLSSLRTNKTHRDIVSKLEESRPLDPDEESVLELYEALQNDDLLGALPIHLDLIRDSSKVPGVAKAAWKGWANVKKARNREIKFIGTLYDMRQSKAAVTGIDKLLRPWEMSYSAGLDQSLFVMPGHYRVAAKLAEGQGLDPQEQLLCQLYSALERRAFGEADATLRHMAQATQELTDIIAAHSGKSFRSEARDRMLIVELHSSARTPETKPDNTPKDGATNVGESGGGALNGLFPGALVDGSEQSRSLPRKRVTSLFPGALVDGSKQSKFSVYFGEKDVLDKDAFANPIHFEIACKLLVQRPTDWKLGGRPVTCSDKVGSTNLS